MTYTKEHVEFLHKKIESLELENQQFKIAIQDVVDLIDNSNGVIGLHLNGSVATWDSLMRGGSFEEWLGNLSDVIEQYL